MAACKKEKRIKRMAEPGNRIIVQNNDPNQYYSQHPAWSFSDVDQEMWKFTQDRLNDVFWSDILPKMKLWESQTWGEILVKAKKQNHSIAPHDLNKMAYDRLVEMKVEAESVISLHLSSTHRLYGYMVGRVFNILWYDDSHGDNKNCVCRSHLKHT